MDKIIKIENKSNSIVKELQKSKGIITPKNITCRIFYLLFIIHFVQFQVVVFFDAC